VLDLGQLVEHAERIFARRQDPHRFGAHERAAAGPVADERERPDVVAQGQQRLLGRQAGGDRDADEPDRHGRRLVVTGGPGSPSAADMLGARPGE
jgi:hypothetical protein